MTWKQFSLVIAAAILAALVTGRAQTPAATNPVYEYHTVVLDDMINGFGEPELNKAGRDGWELVAVRVVIANQDGRSGIAYFKRRK